MANLSANDRESAATSDPDELTNVNGEDATHATTPGNPAGRFLSCIARFTEKRLLLTIPWLCIAWTVISSLSVYPHSLAYFNELAGGPEEGWKHLDQSSLDWGQDMWLVKEWAEEHPQATPLFVVSTGYVPPACFGIHAGHPSAYSNHRPEPTDEPAEHYSPGWYVLGLTQLVDPNNPIHCFLHTEPVASIGYSMRIYHISESHRNGSTAPDLAIEMMHP